MGRPRRPLMLYGLGLWSRRRSLFFELKVQGNAETAAPKGGALLWLRRSWRSLILRRWPYLSRIGLHQTQTLGQGVETGALLGNGAVSWSDGPRGRMGSQASLVPVLVAVEALITRVADFCFSVLRKTVGASAGPARIRDSAACCRRVFRVVSANPGLGGVVEDGHGQGGRLGAARSGVVRFLSGESSLANKGIVYIRK